MKKKLIFYAGAEFFRSRAIRADSSVGRASGLHPEGLGFESPSVHKFWRASPGSGSSILPRSTASGLGAI